MISIYNNNIKILQKVFWVVFISLICFASNSFARQYSFEKGAVSFTIPAPVGELLAINHEFSGSLEPTTGSVQFNVAVAGFNFITSFMPDYINATTTKRFHEYYLETKKFPNASFKGKITNLNKVNFLKDGVYNVEAKGLMTVHGSTREVSRNATITVKGGQARLKANFVLILDDYNVRIPEVLHNVFFKEVTVAVDCGLK